MVEVFVFEANRRRRTVAFGLGASRRRRTDAFGRKFDVRFDGNGVGVEIIFAVDDLVDIASDVDAATPSVDEPVGIVGNFVVVVFRETLDLDDGDLK